MTIRRSGSTVDVNCAIISFYYPYHIKVYCVLWAIRKRNHKCTHEMIVKLKVFYWFILCCTDLKL